MTQLDLRIKYKRETGFAPTYGRYGEDDQLQLFPFISVASCNYKSDRGLTHEYAEWLERTCRKRAIYKSNTAEYGTYYDKHRKLRYTRDYKDWMEERLCESYTSFELAKRKLDLSQFKSAGVPFIEYD